MRGVMPCDDAACPESHMDSGDHSASYEDGGMCEWCGEVAP
ncbi:MAG TPA: hypothetical protein VGS19_29145 [Streptosporangiaceae bacterium]|nr:hypothetical protein [Streptosporangiaceae bacterium]